MLRILATAALLALPLVASAHPVPADPHYGCVIVGSIGIRTPPPATMVTGALGYYSPKSPATSTVHCQTPMPGASFQGAEWASHAAKCPAAPPVVALAGVYCGPVTLTGIVTCAWTPVTLPNGAGFGLVVGVDVDGDGRLTAADKSGPVSPTQKAPWVSEPLPPWSSSWPFGYTMGTVNVQFPPGRIMAFPSVGAGAALDPLAQFQVSCI